MLQNYFYKSSSKNCWSKCRNTYIVGAGKAGYHANKVDKNETEVFILLKHLSKFWRTLNIPLINCEIELILTWSKNSALAGLTVASNPPTGLEFQITDTKLLLCQKKMTKQTFIMINIRI